MRIAVREQIIVLLFTMFIQLCTVVCFFFFIVLDKGSNPLREGPARFRF
jgi:hypothetical protein